MSSKRGTILLSGHFSGGYDLDQLHLKSKGIERLQQLTHTGFRIFFLAGHIISVLSSSSDMDDFDMSKLLCALQKLQYVTAGLFNRVETPWPVQHERAAHAQKQMY